MLFVSLLTLRFSCLVRSLLLMSTIIILYLLRHEAKKPSNFKDLAFSHKLYPLFLSFLFVRSFYKVPVLYLSIRKEGNRHATQRKSKCVDGGSYLVFSFIISPCNPLPLLKNTQDYKTKEHGVRLFGGFHSQSVLVTVMRVTVGSTPRLDLSCVKRLLLLMISDEPGVDCFFSSFHFISFHFFSFLFFSIGKTP